MGYMHIISLYKYPDFFDLFKEIYAMEKIHGTSSWIIFETGSNLEPRYHAGGEKPETFKQLFDHAFIKDELMKIANENKWTKIKIHGECYGGKQQAMHQTYGDKLKFIVFDVFVQDANTSQDANAAQDANASHFLDIPYAEKIATILKLEFVDYARGPNTPEWIEQQSNLQSVQAIRNNMGPNKPREGIVVRPINETIDKNGNRIIAKHKNADFWEIKTRRPLGERLKVLEDTLEIIDEWVTFERFKHVTDRVLQKKEDKLIKITDIKTFIDLMVEDVKRESEGEIVWSDLVNKGIRKKTGIMFREAYPNLQLPNKKKSNYLGFK